MCRIQCRNILTARGKHRRLDSSYTCHTEILTRGTRPTELGLLLATIVATTNLSLLGSYGAYFWNE
jgi:hypothetical protein